LGPKTDWLQVVNSARRYAAIVLAIATTGVAPGPATAAPDAPDRQSELWWTKEQIEAELRSTKLISRWSLSTDSPIPLANSVANPPVSPLASALAPGPATLDVTINSQAWSLLDYFGRYEFANTLGIKAHELGYGLRIMSDRGLVLGQYSCATMRPVQPSGTASSGQCRVQLDSMGQRGSRNRSPF
jgi:hypothetical protein